MRKCSVDSDSEGEPGEGPGSSFHSGAVPREDSRLPELSRPAMSVRGSPCPRDATGSQTQSRRRAEPSTVGQKGGVATPGAS